jgi:hypothetical protein
MNLTGFGPCFDCGIRPQNRGHRLNWTNSKFAIPARSCYFDLGDFYELFFEGANDAAKKSGSCE